MSETRLERKHISNDAVVAFGSIAPNAARVLQRRMSVAARKRQLATKMRHVVKGQHGRRYRTLGKDSDRYLW
jgi:hypothetical protein